jgi:deferrochelatase/peroxidase EfeB
VIADLDSGAIQGNILRGYRSNLRFVRYLMLEIADTGAAKSFLATAASGGSAEIPAITTDETWTGKPQSCFNVAFTFAGLRKIGTPARSLATFPLEFAQGMPSRAVQLADVGASAPANWPAPFDEPDRIHLIASIYVSGDREDDATQLLDRMQQQVARAFHVLGVRNGAGFDNNKVHFGFVDSISQPSFRKEAGDIEPVDPLGTVLLGHPTRLEGLLFRVPEPKELGLNGSFDAFRVLQQDVVGFEEYLDHAAAQIIERLSGDKLNALLAPGDAERITEAILGPRDRQPRTSGEERFLALREIVAAQMCGRWRDGAPLASCADYPDPSASLTQFDYSGTSSCPAGSHVRRANPRGGPMVQRIANYTRRLVRRGVPYGPPYDPAQPDDVERGLLGNFIGANLAGQFEAIMCDWLNLGLQDPTITSSNDPLLGANEPETSWFDLRLKDGTSVRLRGFPRFVITRGGAYTFIPSMDAIRYIAALRG